MSRRPRKIRSVANARGQRRKIKAYRVGEKAGPKRKTLPGTQKILVWPKVKGLARGVVSGMRLTGRYKGFRIRDVSQPVQARVYSRVPHILTSRPSWANPEAVQRAPIPPRYSRKDKIITPELLAEMGWRTSDPCSYCGRPSEDWEHMDSLKKGGAHEAENITRACQRCNSRKNTRSALHHLVREAHLRLTGVR